ncbi:MAG: hypothetical protein HFE51_05070 [Clostridia bacterium]|nr:hypothetical protein [Clostridia bacterium]
MDKFVTQEECEARRKELNEDFDKNFDKIRNDLSKTIGISRVHTEQIGSIQNTLKWLAGIAASLIAAVLLLIIKGALKI